MSYTEFPVELYRRYLSLLGVPARRTGIEALAEIVRAHLIRVPFENVSKLYYVRKSKLPALLPFNDFLDGIERLHFGGTCYTTNYYLNCLLNHLGYEAKLCGADMRNPDVHLVNLVTLDSREYIVDVGYAAPFFSPMPRDLTEDSTISFGTDRYVVHPQDSAHRTKLDHYKDGELRHGYVVNPRPRRIEEFTQAIADSFHKNATFMNALLLVQYRDGGSFIIRNMNAINVSGQTVRTEPIRSRHALQMLIHDSFGIPRDIIEESLAGIQLNQDALD